MFTWIPYFPSDPRPHLRARGWDDGGERREREQERRRGSTGGRGADDRWRFSRCCCCCCCGRGQGRRRGWRRRRRRRCCCCCWWGRGRRGGRGGGVRIRGRGGGRRWIFLQCCDLSQWQFYSDLFIFQNNLWTKANRTPSRKTSSGIKTRPDSLIHTERKEGELREKKEDEASMMFSKFMSKRFYCLAAWREKRKECLLSE